jgi:hypothetical protein
VFLWLANWWDGVDLWLSELAFPFQFAIVIAVLAPVCIAVAWVVDGAVDLVSARFRRSRDVPAPGALVVSAPVLVNVRADVLAGTPATITRSAVVAPVDAVAAGRGSESGAS